MYDALALLVTCPSVCQKARQKPELVRFLGPFARDQTTVVSGSAVQNLLECQNVEEQRQLSFFNAKWCCPLKGDLGYRHWLFQVAKCAVSEAILAQKYEFCCFCHTLKMVLVDFWVLLLIFQRSQVSTQ